MNFSKNMTFDTKSESIDISVIIPVYNVERFLQICIDSLMSQTMNNIEYIFVNDASTDRSLEILKKNQKNYSDKMIVIDSPKNLRQGGARNLGVARAKGSYIGFCDSDDFVAPKMYEILYKNALESGADATYIQYTAVDEDADLSIISSKDRLKPLISFEHLMKYQDCYLSDDRMQDIMIELIGGCYCGLYKRDIVKRSFFPEKLRYEDNFWGGILRCYINKYHFIPEILYFYRQNSNSTVHKKNQKYHFDRITIENMLIQEAEKRHFFDRYYAAWEYQYITRYARNSYDLYVSRFDHLPQKQLMRISYDLKKHFPNWENNKYYCIKEPERERKALYYKMRHPLACAYFEKIIQFKNKIGIRSRVKAVLKKIT